ncbi:hypothetical protein [Nostoc sp. PCC 7107]|uniref:hypothetical protein n=1 Tax=Nostoc sp. PCC 7107 TaxID=317936 RepID=UPI00029EC385|nr:hypothetical protein [Nostoc sp. PCC 7107]AFY44751.1 hypothetical protein Nos7107_4200 [Nostoc sp. PCC 7107]
MPDGDKFHSRLSWRYQEAYRDLCERKFDSSEIVWTVKKALLQDIKKSYGDQPVKYAKRLGEMLQGAIKNAGNNSFVDWATLSKDIDRQVGQTELKYYEKGLLLRAAKAVLNQFRYNRRVDTSNFPEAVVGQFFLEIYKSNFEERIPLTPNHYADLDRITVMECVEAINPEISVEISKWAKKATLDEDVKKLRRSPRQKVKEIDLEENLL